MTIIELPQSDRKVFVVAENIIYVVSESNNSKIGFAGNNNFLLVDEDLDTVKALITRAAMD